MNVDLVFLDLDVQARNYFFIPITWKTVWIFDNSALETMWSLLLAEAKNILENVKPDGFGCWNAMSTTEK